MTPRKAAAGKTPRAAKTTRAAKQTAPAPGGAAKKQDSGGASEEWFVGPYGDLISRADYVALMKRAGQALDEGE